MSYPLKIYLTAFQKTEAAYRYYEGLPMGWYNKNILKSPEDTYSKLSPAPKNYGCLGDDKNIGGIKIHASPFVTIFQNMEYTAPVMRVFNTNRIPELLKNI